MIENLEQPSGPDRRTLRGALGLFLGLLAAVIAGSAQARPIVALIIDDLGWRAADGERAVRLPGAVTVAILPHAPHSRALAETAHRQGKEIMLHLPMEAAGGNRLGPGALTEALAEKEFKRTVFAGLASVPYVRGINNHMGSRLTADPLRMRWLMQFLMFREDLYFVDSRTTAATVAEREARRRALPATHRDVFIDYEDDAAIIEAQLEKLIARAHRKGSALGIGHPLPRTLAALERWLPTLADRGVELVPVSRLVAWRQTQRRNPTWQASLSPSLKVAKNSKPSPSSISCGAPASRSSQRVSKTDPCAAVVAR